MNKQAQVLTKLFNNEKFGAIRMVTIEGKPYAVAKDVAIVLGYKNTNDAINTHCKGVVKHEGFKLGGNMASLIPQGDIIRLATKCPLDGAEEFESWIFDVVIPSVLNNGGYISEDATEDQVKKLVENYSMRSITKTIHECNIFELENVVNEILESNTNGGKRNRVDSRLKNLDATEYKQHVRKHIRKAIESKPYSKDIKAHGVEMAIRDRLVIELTDDVLETTNRKFAQLI